MKYTANDFKFGIQSQGEICCRAQNKAIALEVQGRHPNSIIVNLSANHAGLTPDNKGEYLVKDDQVYIAPFSNVLQTNGDRLGRWECTLEHAKRYQENQLYKGLELRD